MKNNLSKDRQKQLNDQRQAGMDYQRLKDNKSLKELIDSWRSDAKAEMIGCDAFDSQTHIRARVTLDAIDYLEHSIESGIEGGKQAEQILIEGEDNEPGIL